MNSIRVLNGKEMNEIKGDELMRCSCHHL